MISEPCELYKTDLRKYYYLSRESLSIYEDNTTLFNEKEKSFLAAILNAKVAQLENLINELKEMSPDSQERIINSVLRKFKTDSEVRFNLISLLFAEFTDYQSEICDIIKTKEKSFFIVFCCLYVNKMCRSFSGWNGYLPPAGRNLSQKFSMVLRRCLVVPSPSLMLWERMG